MTALAAACLIASGPASAAITAEATPVPETTPEPEVEATPVPETTPVPEATPVPELTPLPGVTPEVVAPTVPDATSVPESPVDARSPCQRGQYGRPLSDGVTVDVGCDGRMSLSEQGGGVTLALTVTVPPDGEATAIVDERRVGGSIVDVDRSTARGGRITGLQPAVLYTAPAGMVGFDAFSLWWWDGEVAREVRVVVEVERRSGAPASVVPIGRLLSDDRPDEGEPIDPIDLPGVAAALAVPLSVAVGVPLLTLVVWFGLRRGRVGRPGSPGPGRTLSRG